MQPRPPFVSIVTSTYLSAPFLQEFYSRCDAAATRLTDAFEIVFVNDGSPDDSLQVALDLRERDPRVRIIDLSRNFGHHKALMTGLAHARRRAGVPDRLRSRRGSRVAADVSRGHARDKADVVYGVQAERKGDWFERVDRRLFFQRLQPAADASHPRQRGHGAADDPPLRQGAGRVTGSVSSASPACG